ncbi:MAG: hypothetical protein IT324_24305 [Anaerolineae bacterium]|nr:hypothetical protein [Anaerolineae bacterium]
MNGFNLVIKPDAEEIEAAEVYVDGMIGSSEYHFLLDTGAAKTSVVADEYTSTFISSEKHNSLNVFSSSSDDVIIVPSITIGSITKQDFPVVRRAGNATRQTNLIGMNLIKDFCCHFLFDENRVAIESNDLVDTGRLFQELFFDKTFHPYINLEIGLAKAKAVWDTGASITVADVNFIKKHAALFQEAGQSAGTDASGSTVETPMFIMSEATIGNRLFPPHKVAGVDLSPLNSTAEIPMDLILGYSTLSKANWLFDFPRKQWTISRWLDTSVMA